MTETMDMSTHPERHPVRYLDRHASLTVILAVVIQTAAIMAPAIWWASGLSKSVAQLVKSDEQQAAQIASLKSHLHPVTVDDVRRIKELVQSNAILLSRVQAVQEQMSLLIKNGLHKHSASSPRGLVIKPPPHEIR